MGSGGRRNTAVTAICGKIEAELAELPPADQMEYLASYGLKESGLVRLISATYALLGLTSFLTAGEDEVRAWTIPAHSTAVKAAGAIHSDFERSSSARSGQLANAGRSRRLRRPKEKDYCGWKEKSTSSKTATCS